jgi:hypothetical protein
VEDETDEEIAGLLEESSSLKKLIADIKELDPASCDSEIKEHQMRIVEVILTYIFTDLINVHMYSRFLKKWRYSSGLGMMQGRRNVWLSRIWQATLQYLLQLLFPGYFRLKFM